VLGVEHLDGREDFVGAKHEGGILKTKPVRDKR
jgi:hypothetical protein